MPGAGLAGNRRRAILEVDVANAPRVPGEEVNRVAAAVGRVPRIDAQADEIRIGALQ